MHPRRSRRVSPATTTTPAIRTYRHRRQTTTLPGYGPTPGRSCRSSKISHRHRSAPQLAALQAEFATIGRAAGVFKRAQDPIIVAAGRIQHRLRHQLPGRHHARMRRNQSISLTFNPIKGGSCTLR